MRPMRPVLGGWTHWTQLPEADYIEILNQRNKPLPDNFWRNADIIHIYTRRQAIEDGVLVQLSGLGY